MAEERTEWVDAARPNVERGDFPFPIMDGEDESHYLRWLRDHSNFMAVGGLLDYLRAISVLARGVAINFLVFLPLLLLIGVAVAAYHQAGEYRTWVMGGGLVATLGGGLFRTLSGRGETAQVVRRFFWVVAMVPAIAVLVDLVWGAKAWDHAVFRYLWRYDEAAVAYLMLTVSYAVLLGLALVLWAMLRGGRGERASTGSPWSLLLFPAVTLVAGATYWRWFWAGEFGLTATALTLAVAYTVLFPLATPLFRMSRQRTVMETGSDSSVSIRDGYERSFAVLLLALIAFLAFEAVSAVVPTFHRQRDLLLGWPAIGLLVGVAGLVVGADKVLFKEGKGARKLGILAVGVLGLLIPLLVVLLVADFLIFDYPRIDALISAEALWKWSWALPLVVVLFAWRTFKGRLFWGSTVVCLLAALSLPMFGKGATDFAVQRLFEARGQLDTLAMGRWDRPSADKQRRDWESIDSALGLSMIDTTAEFVSMAAQIRGDAARIFETLGKVPTTANWGEYWPVPEQDSAQQVSIQQDSIRSLLEGIKDAEPVTKLAGVDGNGIASILTSRSLYDSVLRKWSKVEDPVARQAARDLLSLSFDLRQLRDEILIAGIRSEAEAFRSIYRADAGILLGVFRYKLVVVLMLAATLFGVFWLTVDVNLTSIHGLYRDRLASAFLVGENALGLVDVEEDLDLPALANYDAGSTAPYHLINAALNLQGSDSPGIRDRKSDYFIFSKRFSGGESTGYCLSERMERHYPQMDLSTAMAISAAAASPNMGRATNPALVATMALLNIRLGFWVPNPGALEEEEYEHNRFSFLDVFRAEIGEIANRWKNLPAEMRESRALADTKQPTVAHGLVGIAYSGGGIRSATLNLGITQALHRGGVFDHVDYMSTVSGGGYLGASISSFMRKRSPAKSDADPVAGADDGERAVSIARRDGGTTSIFRWQVPSRALVREALGMLDEKWKWVNVSDGGHIENMGTIELLRRRCKYIIVGDGEEDSQHHFKGLANLMRLARIDLGIHIDIDLDALRLGTGSFCQSHWAIGEIHYPEETAGTGYLLYVKSSMTGDEDEIIREYRDSSPGFPHESTADISFTEGQFEAYRSLGQHIGERVLSYAGQGGRGGGEPWQRRRGVTLESPSGRLDYRGLEDWFAALKKRARNARLEETAVAAP